MEEPELAYQRSVSVRKMETAISVHTFDRQTVELKLEDQASIIIPILFLFCRVVFNLILVSLHALFITSMRP